MNVNNSASTEDMRNIFSILNANELEFYVCQQGEKKKIVLDGELSEGLVDELRQCSGVAQVIVCSTPYKLASLAMHPERTVLCVGGVEIGGDRVVLMAGPCAIESMTQLEGIGMELKRMGVSIMRGSAYKPRSSPYSFQGMGPEGVTLHARAQKKHGLGIVTEVLDVQDLEWMMGQVDMLQIGARNMQNYALLKAVGKSGKPVILKRGLSATIEEWILSAEYIMVHGNPNVILCERGIRTFETATRNTLDVSSIPVLKRLTHLPVIVDPSHAAGRCDLVPALSKAAIAAGADGLLIEVHQDPKNAKCDGSQSLLPSELEALIPDLRKVAIAVGRTL